MFSLGVCDYGEGGGDTHGGLVFEAHRLCVSLNSRLESNKEEEGGGNTHGSRGVPRVIGR